jgi:hypothetical protein
MSRPSSTAKLLSRLKEQGLPPEEDVEPKPKRVRKRKRKEHKGGTEEKKQKTEQSVLTAEPIEAPTSLFTLLHAIKDFSPANFLKSVKWY